MEDNQNKDSRHFNPGSEDASINLKSKLPDWLLGFFRPPMVCTFDLQEDLLEGYPDDDGF